jgi:hypothetical protein
VDKEKLGLALERLRGIQVLCITEEFDLSTKLFSQKTEIKFKETLKLNMTPEIDATESEIARIKELVDLDIELYEEAKRIFYDECKKHSLIKISE